MEGSKFLQNKRATGRTTRMFQRAIEAARQGRAVYVFVASGLIRRRLEHSLLEAGEYELVRTAAIKVEIGLPRGFEWDPVPRVVGMHPNCEVLIDHDLIERQFGSILEAWCAFDEEPSVSGPTGEDENRRGARTSAQTKL